MKSIHNITTKVFETEFGFGHYTVLLYDDEHYELYEMSRPMDVGGINNYLSYGKYDGEIFEAKGIGEGIFRSLEMLGEEIPMEELMHIDNEDLRTAIKLKQEQFYPY